MTFPIQNNARQQDQIKIQNLEEEASNLKKKLKTLEYEMESKNANMREIKRKHEDDMMLVRRSLRETEAKYSSLAATPPKASYVVSRDLSYVV